MKNHIFFIALSISLLFPFRISAEVRILSPDRWKPDIIGSWNCENSGLSYTNTVYGDTYYNPNWQDMSKASNIESASIVRYFNLKPNYKRGWTFSMTITNLNAEKGHLYYNKNFPNKKQSSDQIYWGLRIGYIADGKSRETIIWIYRSSSQNPYISSDFIGYNVDNYGWRRSDIYYPECFPSKAPTFEIKTGSYSDGDHTYIKWGNLSITDLPVYIEELKYIVVNVGTQAKIQIGKPSAYADACGYANRRDASDLISQDRFREAIAKLYQKDENYYEKPAYNLAYCYLMVGEYDNAVKICNALIKYNGETLQKAYIVRGLAKEGKEEYLEALEDYKHGGESAIELYSRLYSTIYNVSNRQKSQHSSQQINKKPQLTR